MLLTLCVAKPDDEKKSWAPMLRICPIEHTTARGLCILLLICVPAVNVLAQIPAQTQRDLARNPQNITKITGYNTAPGTGVLVFHVFAEKKSARMEGPVRLTLTNLANHIGVFQTTEDDAEGVFADLAFGTYEIEVSALGFVSARQEVRVVSIKQVEPIDIVLQRDPSAINLDVIAGIISPKTRKEVRRAVSKLKVGDLAGAQKHLEAAYKLAPSSSDLNFLLGYLYYQRKEYAQTRTYLTAAASLGPHNAQALTLLGRTELEQEHYPAARSALEQAVLADDDNWLPHNLLADAYLGQKDYGKARDEAHIAITKGQKVGKTIASPAQLVLAQALIGLGQEQEAIQALEVFLKDSPQNPMVYQVRNLIADLKKSNSGSAPHRDAKNSDINMSRADPLGAVPEPALTTQTWRPADVDDTRPTLVPDVACSTSRVLDESGKRVQGVSSGSRPLRRQRKVIPSVDRPVWLCNRHRDTKVRLRRNRVGVRAGLCFH